MDHVTIDLRNYELQQEQAQMDWDEHAYTILENEFNRLLKTTLAESGEIYAEMDRQELVADLFVDIGNLVQAFESNTYIGNTMLDIRNAYVKVAKEMVVEMMMNDHEEKYRKFLEGL